MFEPKGCPGGTQVTLGLAVAGWVMAWPCFGRVSQPETLLSPRCFARLGQSLQRVRPPRLPQSLQTTQAWWQRQSPHFEQALPSSIGRWEWSILGGIWSLLGEPPFEVQIWWIHQPPPRQSSDPQSIPVQMESLQPLVSPLVVPLTVGGSQSIWFLVEVGNFQGSRL